MSFCLFCVLIRLIYILGTRFPEYSQTAVSTYGIPTLPCANWPIYSLRFWCPLVVSCLAASSRVSDYYRFLHLFFRIVMSFYDLEANNYLALRFF